MKKTFVQKVLDYLKEGDESKLEKFRKENVRNRPESNTNRR